MYCSIEIIGYGIGVQYRKKHCIVICISVFTIECMNTIGNKQEKQVGLVYFDDQAYYTVLQKQFDCFVVLHHGVYAISHRPKGVSDVIVALPDHEVIIQQWSLEEHHVSDNCDAHIHEMAKEKYQYDPDSIYWDYEIDKQISPPSVRFIAAKSDAVNQLIDKAQSTGVFVTGVGSMALALERYIAYFDPSWYKQNIVIVWESDGAMIFIQMNLGKVVRTRWQNIEKNDTQTVIAQIVLLIAPASFVDIETIQFISSTLNDTQLHVLASSIQIAVQRWLPSNQHFKANDCSFDVNNMKFAVSAGLAMQGFDENAH